MHKFLRAVGFSKITKEELNDIFQKIIERPMLQKVAEDSEGNEFAELSIEFGDFFGLSLRGTFNENDSFEMSYYYPYFCGNKISTTEQIDIEKHAEKESYAGACDDMRLGVTLIFYLQNPAEYMLEKYKGNVREGQPLTITGLAREGKILFPVQKDKEAVKVERELTKNRNNLIAAARNGDEEAMEDLTMEDMDMYSMISERIVTDDVLTIVDTCFMPHGIECDQYSVMGEIVDFVNFKNILTGEKLCQMTIECNDIQFDVCINCADLLGEPAVGRRFKGLIWLQGQLHF